MCVEFLTVVAGDRKIALFTRDSLLDGFFFVRKEKKKRVDYWFVLVSMNESRECIMHAEMAKE
jgi:hypothetical protein